jgi:hypothetical protein
MKITRRKLATALAPSLLAVRAARPAAPQSSPAPQGPAAAIDAARARMKQTSDLLAQQSVPMDIEPAFQFKA